MKKFVLLNLLGCLLFALIILSCKKDSETKPQVCYLTNVSIETNQGLQARDSYEYNLVGQLVKHTYYFDSKSSLSSVIEYNPAGQIVRISKFRDQQTTPEDEFLFEYRNNGRTVIRTNPADLYPEVSTFTLKFNESDQLLQYGNRPNGIDLEYFRYEYDQQGNLLKVLKKQATQTAEYTVQLLDSFDDKVGHYFTPITLRMYYQLMGGVAISSHNALSIRLYNPDGTLWLTDTASNQYNESNYIIDKKGNYGGNNYHYIYTYNCSLIK